MPGGWSAHTPPEQGLAETPSSGVGRCELAALCGEMPFGCFWVYVWVIGETESKEKIKILKEYRNIIIVFILKFIKNKFIYLKL